MVITFPDETYAVTCTWKKAHFLLKRQFKTKNKWKAFATTLLPF